MNNPAKQDDIVHWHKIMDNLISIVTETKLKSKVRLWIMNKFDGVQVFTSGLDAGHLGSGVVIIMDNSLAQHVYKVVDVPGWLISIRLLFKNKLSVLILELYAEASLAICSFQMSDINSMIAKTVNESFFIILDGDFNENGSHKSANFKKCFDMDLINSLMDHNVVSVDEYFDTDYNAVSVSVGLGGLLDVQLNSLHKQANKDHWKYNFKNANDNK
ncbi:hypothetical protein G9A89_022866 [Geosiphon pyriformis]|nr:hypothetical protein G9A89_022866 [Geosiphon pyriformis]